MRTMIRNTRQDLCMINLFENCGLTDHYARIGQVGF
jgi:hypothetical protein